MPMIKKLTLYNLKAACARVMSGKYKYDVDVKTVEDKTERKYYSLYKFVPIDDMTAYELAMIMKKIGSIGCCNLDHILHDKDQVIQKMPFELRRHFLPVY